MNGNPKTEIDELFSASIDDALTQRQQTELKRLLQHQPEMAEQLGQLERQRQLLCSLPIETAPASLADDVKARLERKLILDDAARTRGIRSRGAMVQRRFTAAAAMLLLPLALLGYVVYRIVTPEPDAATRRPTAGELLREETLMTTPQMASPAIPERLPFDGVLTLTTERPMLVAQSIEKQIFLKALEHQMIPNRTAEVTTFQIDCPVEAMAELLGSLSPLWNQIADGRLTLRDSDAPQRMITIDHIRPEQIQVLARQTDKMPLQAAAHQYAAANRPLRPDAGRPDALGDDDAMTLERLAIPRPILAWPEREAQGKAVPQPHVRLIIDVRRPE
jgi:hypothetical protein